MEVLTDYEIKWVDQQCDYDVVMMKRKFDSATATLERVQAALCEEGCGECAFVRRALADQPEAPECNYVGRCNSSRCPKHGQPEAPKGQEPWQTLFPQAQAEWDRLKGSLAAAKAEAHSREGALRATCDALVTANARIAELEASNAAGWAIARARVEALNAANARIAELEMSNAVLDAIRQGVPALVDEAMVAKAALQGEIENHGKTLSALAAANARIAELEEDNTRARNLVRQSQEDYAGQRKATEAANARIAELESEKAALVEAHDMWKEQWHAANARADAAERKLASVVKECEDIDYESNSYLMAAHILYVIKK